MTAPPRRGRRLALSLRALLILVLAAGLLLAWRVDRARRQREAVEAIRAYGGWVYYDHEIVAGLPSPGTEPGGPRWLRRLVGDEPFRRVAQVNLVYNEAVWPRRQENRRTDAAVMDRLDDLPGLRSLVLRRGQTTDAALRHVGRHHALRELTLLDADLTDAGAAVFEDLPHLKLLDLDNSRLTDAGFAHLAGLVELEVLSLQGNYLTDAGLAHLSGLTSLRELYLGLSNGRLTDAGLVHLEGLKRLEVLDLQHSAVTDAGLEHLLGRLPRLREVWLLDSHVTPDGAERLMQARPKLLIRS